MRALPCLLLTAFTLPALAAGELRVRLAGDNRFTEDRVRMRCTGDAAQLGLPLGTFVVRYLHGRAGELALVPIHGTDLIFVNVLSGSGARYVARELTWWNKGNDAEVSSEQESTLRASCTSLP